MTQKALLTYAILAIWTPIYLATLILFLVGAMFARYPVEGELQRNWGMIKRSWKHAGEI